jgi:hypothetical protein
MWISKGPARSVAPWVRARLSPSKALQPIGGQASETSPSARPSSSCGRVKSCRLELAGVVKVPTAGNGLGTGQTDYGVQATFYRPLLAGVRLFGSVGHQRIGDSNTLRLHDGERGTVGLDINYSNWGGGALLDYEKSLFPGVPNSFTVDPYVTVPFLFGSGLQVYTTIALTRQNPNHEVGVRLVL